jgi:hypothetical protein
MAAAGVSAARRGRMAGARESSPAIVLGAPQHIEDLSLSPY